MGSKGKNNEAREKMIQELQKHAATVLELKQERRQKRPIVIEFSGSPKAGKSSCINSLQLFLKRNGFAVRIVQESASICPVRDKQSPMYNIWTVCQSLTGMIGVLENDKEPVDVLLLDRGIFDALCWFQWHVKSGTMEKKQKAVTEAFLLMEEIVNSIDIVFAFVTKPEVSIGREYATLLTDKLGSIMNEKVLDDYREAVYDTVKLKEKYFHQIFVIDTTEKDQDAVGREVTEKTLETLRNLLMERIGYFEKTKTLMERLKGKKISNHEELADAFPVITYDLRDNVEENDLLLQPIPVAVITNRSKTKILVIKKNKNSAAADSPEHDRILLYIGGHSRDEDYSKHQEGDFLSVCRNTLRREVKEEIGISVAIDDVIPFYIYDPSNAHSGRHMAVCFPISVDEDEVKLRLDAQELILNKGKSKSGHFLTINEILEEQNLEAWSVAILEHCFQVEWEKEGQISMDDLW